MANQIQLSLAAALANANTVMVNWFSGPVNFNQTGQRYSDFVQSITSTAVPLSIGSIGTLGYFLAVNLDTATNNPVYILTTSAATTGAAIACLYGGQFAILPLGAGMQTPAAAVTTTTGVYLKTIVFEL